MSTILLANSRLSGKSSKPRRPCFGKRRSLKPTDEAENIGRQRGEEMLEMRLALANIARSAQARITRGLRECAFYATACAIHLMKFRRLLTCPRRLQHGMAFRREA